LCLPAELCLTKLLQRSQSASRRQVLVSSWQAWIVNGGLMSKRPNDVHLDKDRLEIIKWVTTLRDRVVLDMLKRLKENPKKIDWWNGISEDEKKAIELRNQSI
jgi:hypothetical protein